MQKGRWRRRGKKRDRERVREWKREGERESARERERDWREWEHARERKREREKARERKKAQTSIDSATIMPEITTVRTEMFSLWWIRMGRVPAGVCLMASVLQLALDTHPIYPQRKHLQGRLFSNKDTFAQMGFMALFSVCLPNNLFGSSGRAFDTHEQSRESFQPAAAEWGLCG